MLKKNITLIFIIFQTALYLWFLTLDLTDGSIALSGIVKFVMIVLCFVYVLMCSGKFTRELLFLRFALLFTVISDLIILFLPAGCYFYGVCTFVIAQQFHSLRLFALIKRNNGLGNDKKYDSAWLMQLFFLLVLSIIFILILKRFHISVDWLLGVTIFYFVCLVMNVIRSLRIAVILRKERSSLLFAVGLVLFLLCDINVGLFNLSDYIILPGNLNAVLYSISAILMWTFYAPSQVLIALSAEQIRQ